MIKVIDIAYYQNSLGNGKYGAINFEKMRDAGASKVIIKANDGVWLDRQALRNFKDSKGILDRGAYTYFQASDDPIEQAIVAYQVATQEGEPEEPFAVDLEYNSKYDKKEPNPSDYVYQVNDFLWKIYELDGRVPWVYTRYSFVLSYLPRPDPYIQPSKHDAWFNLSKYLLWLAQYSTDKRVALSQPSYVPLPWFTHHRHQKSADGNNLGSAHGVRSRSIDISEEKDLSNWVYPLPENPNTPPTPGDILWKVIRGPLLVRSSPTTSTSNNVLGSLPTGTEVVEAGIWQDGDNKWLIHDYEGVQAYSAIYYGGVTYMERV